MKNFWKRGFALFLAMILVLALSVPALAEEPLEPEQTEEPLPTEEPAPTEEPKLLVGGEDASPEEPDPCVELYVSKEGDDEKGSGSQTAPFASLARAAEEANKTPEQPVLILVLTDLEAKRVARFTGRDVTIQAAEKPVTVTRAEGFEPAKDKDGGWYNPAMIELRAPENSKLTAGKLSLVNVILDDAGRHEGSLFETAQEPAPAEEPTEAEAAEQPAEPETAEAQETEPAAAQDAAAPAEEPSAPAPADRRELVQEAIVSVGEGGSLTLSTGAELRNFGGRSAVSLGEKSSLCLEPESAIRDTEKAENTLPAIQAPESAKVETFKGSQLLERSEQPEEPALPEGLLDGSEEETGEEETGAETSLELSAPESITRLLDSSVLRYPVDYTLSFTLSERLKSLIEGAHNLGAEAEVSGTITLTLDERLTPDLAGCKLQSSVFELDGEPTQEGNKVVAKFKLKEDWAAHIDELTQPMTFTCGTNLSALDFKESTAEQDEYLVSTAKVSLEGTVSGRHIGPYDSTEKTAKTKMLGLGNATIVYDPNGGVGGPGQESNVSPQKEYPLKTEPAPTHEAVDGVPVVFLGWSETRLEKIYANGEEKPETVSTVSVKGVEELPDLLDNSVTVYAVYGYDTNGDGVADIDQVLATLSFDPNGGENAPDPIIHVVGSTESGDLGVNIPEQEPNRDYYTFVGWGETADATKSDKLYKYDSDKEGRRDIPVTQDKTLYAVWEKNYQINYDANGGSNAPAATVLLTQTKTGTDSSGNPTYTGRAQITDRVPTRSGYSFQGWATSRRGAAAYFAGDEVQISGGSVTLYAVWTRDGSGSSSSGGSGSSSSGGSGSGAPKTGDPGTGIYALLQGGSILGLCAVGIVLRRKRA